VQAPIVNLTAALADLEAQLTLQGVAETMAELVALDRSCLNGSLSRALPWRLRALLPIPLGGWA
jgi:hypothetical protein